MDKRIVAVTKEISPIVKDAQDIVIKTVKDMEKATEMLSQLNLKSDAISKEKKTITEPAKAIVKRENERWEPIEKPLKEGIAILREKLSDYQTAEVKRQEEEEAKIANRVGEGKGKFKSETAMRKIDEVEKPVEAVSTASGGLSFRTDKVLKVVNLDLIPREYFDLNEKRALDALKAGVSVPGAVIEKKQTPINSRN